ncbi:type IV toxin-antitoxin system AbiEi family antitoxin [Mesorhizobium sp. M0983]|uniref:type IV toxin-antitoxin system AbiEi family antitoxin domain-containing protein n=1 Tax=Mesorhizobium sp. M0983 TaxID=2957040 RepID=UPI0033360FEE
MSRQSPSKLKSLLQSVPPGFLIDSGWMKRHAISRQSTSAYVARGWLERVAQGVYRRPFSRGESSEARSGWKIPLLSAQWLMGYGFHVGGMSALDLRGHAHYLRLGDAPSIYLYGEDVPDWLMKLDTDAHFVRHRNELFEDPALGVDDATFSLSDSAEDGLTLSPWLWPIKMSSAERAVLETLDEVPRAISFHTMDTVFEALVSLRPRLLARLLMQCRSVKVKRLFFVYADKHGHPWRKHIDISELDLGRGDRSLLSGGRLHPTYRITVPADLLPGEASDA